ncbi:TetR/AcrR family transcriptional regulator [Pseudonocardia sp. KRD291]|uniref:TetR/AcrR family transcriptional regulator n=1 Tax=Pseudonocardia sp. KRD291 TaxID=2792007 RepID=UPI001C4A7287|nr:TetR family transcriptional regulator [Pseudonocardia sp. KRD291]MBW0102294.1 TetR family transcriptional regulator [Pseudonocardia sp. KRD291]
MTTGTPARDAAPRRRPRDRKQQILAAARERFWSQGYHRVAMADLAASVDIGASALYRHFRGKQELLLAVLDDDLTHFERAAHAPGTDPVDGIARVGLERRGFGVIWEREAGHLPEPERRAIRHRLRALSETLGAASPDRAAADIRTWAALSVLDSPSHHRSSPDPERFRQLITGSARACLAAPLPAPAATGPAGRHDPPRLVPASRREALLAAAVRLFAERGYPSVGLIDIGAATGIAGPSVYNHFPTKNDLLEAALRRGEERLWLGLHHVLARADDEASALRLLVEDYTAFASTDPQLVGILLSEIIHLPAERRTAFRTRQLDYVAEWVALFRAARPGLEVSEARVLVHAALAVVNSLTRIRHLRSHPGIDAEIAALAHAVLRPDQ